MSRDQKQICLYCLAWKVIDSHTFQFGECRKHAPKLGQNDGEPVPVWPPTTSEDWCLDFKERSDDHA
jgi:hypothetical protein